MKEVLAALVALAKLAGIAVKARVKPGHKVEPIPAPAKPPVELP